MQSRQNRSELDLHSRTDSCGNGGEEGQVKSRHVCHDESQRGPESLMVHPDILIPEMSAGAIYLEAGARCHKPYLLLNDM